MKPSLIDTDMLSLFFKDHPQVKTAFSSYIKQYKKINISIITYYEIVSDLKHFKRINGLQLDDWSE